MSIQASEATPSEYPLEALRPGQSPLPVGDRWLARLPGLFGCGARFGHNPRCAAQRATGIPAHQGYLHVLGNKPDNRILDCDVAGYADAIATGDRAMLELTCRKPDRRSREPKINHLLPFRG
jgi:hypothetical protein